MEKVENHKMMENHKQKEALNKTFHTIRIWKENMWKNIEPWKDCKIMKNWRQEDGEPQKKTGNDFYKNVYKEQQQNLGVCSWNQRDNGF